MNTHTHMQALGERRQDKDTLVSLDQYLSQVLLSKWPNIPYTSCETVFKNILVGFKSSLVYFFGFLKRIFIFSIQTSVDFF